MEPLISVEAVPMGMLAMDGLVGVHESQDFSWTPKKRTEAKPPDDQDSLDPFLGSYRNSWPKSGLGSHGKWGEII